MADERFNLLDNLKSQVWQALDDKIPVPGFEALLTRPVTIFDVYYLLEQWAALTIWDAMNLEAPSKPEPIDLEGCSEHYQIFDRGSCLVATPKDLFSHDRTLKDAIEAAQAMVREVYRRRWKVEFIGFEKMERAAWVEAQILEDLDPEHWRLEIIRYNPSLKDIRIYNLIAEEAVKRRKRLQQSSTQ